VKKSLEFLIIRDEGQDGIIDGPQHNTLDADWFGQVAWLSSLYVAALRAGEAMARELGDDEFAVKARAIADAGSRNIDQKLFNGEYYVQLPDRDHPRSVGSYDGCEIDQVFGQSWAHQVGLGRLLSEAHVKSALGSLWKYNFTPDVGPYREAHKPGRWYAMAGEAGLLMCAWPRGEGARIQQGFDYYFNECMTGFEYQAAGHMICEGMLLEGLAVTRAVHDRYHASRRNSWNEIECGDHYARAMASYGVFLAACGFEYHGPKCHLGFAPRLAPEKFKAAFTGAEGWGSFAQQAEGGRLRAQVALRWGRLRLKTLALALPAGARGRSVRMTLDGRAVRATSATIDSRLLITLAAELALKAGQKLEVRLG
jgi:non-lysosomal glucosylceramidase